MRFYSLRNQHDKESDYVATASYMWFILCAEALRERRSTPPPPPPPPALRVKSQRHIPVAHSAIRVSAQSKIF